VEFDAPRWYTSSAMQSFRAYLKTEFTRRTTVNPSYSLRAFGKSLKISHATLSSVMSGRRKLTKASALKIGQALGLGPQQIFELINKDQKSQQSFHLLQQDQFNSIADWFYDAILELAKVRKIKLDPENVAKALNISSAQAQLALETLERLELLKRSDKGIFELQHAHTTNILDSDFTSSALRKYQRSIMERSLIALDTVERTRRDHTSTTMAVNVRDIPKVKELIQKFRHEMNQFLQREEVEPNDVYQLQVSFFPLTQLNQKDNIV